MQWQHRGWRYTMLTIATPDILALAYFAAAWIFYSILIERSNIGKASLNALMNMYRSRWMLEMLARPVRIVDSQVTAALQNGTAFFASTSLIAVGGALTLLKSTEEIITVVSVLPFAGTPTRALWEAKMLGLAVIFVYAFFKFAWSYRLYNYVAILIGAAPPPDQSTTMQARKLAHRAAEICADAGRHFNRGQRAFFFALGYLGWFLGPLPLALTTTCTVIVMYRRQFYSQSRDAFAHQPEDPPPEARRVRRSPSKRR